MDIERGEFPQPPNYELCDHNKIRGINHIGDEYKMMRRLTIPLVIAIIIIFLLSFTVFSLSINPKFQSKWS